MTTTMAAAAARDRRLALAGLRLTGLEDLLGTDLKLPALGSRDVHPDNVALGSCAMTAASAPEPAAQSAAEQSADQPPANALPAELDELWDRRACTTPADRGARNLVVAAGDPDDSGLFRRAAGGTRPRA